MDVKIKEEACIGCGICANMCSDTFEMGQDNKAHIRTEPEMGTSHEACAREAVTDCPTNAIVMM